MRISGVRKEVRHAGKSPSAQSQPRSPKHQAKDLLKAHAARAPEAAQLIREFHPRFHSASDVQVFAAQFRLSDAQLTIARESGFPSWTRLKRHIEKPTLSDRLELPHHERIEDARFRHAVDLLDAGDLAGLRTHLKQHPNLAHKRVLFEGGNYFRNPTLLEFVAENPTRHGTLPKNIVDVTRVILDAGTGQAVLDETLMLVASSDVGRKCARATRDDRSPLRLRCRSQRRDTNDGCVWRVRGGSGVAPARCQD